MMKTINGRVGLCGLAAVCALAVGCDRARELSEKEALERSTRLYSNAMDDYRAGRLEAAIKGFERVVLDEPKSYSAHFQLATLLHDVRKDYIGAIAHYRAYLALRPASDKANVATDRVKLCETLLASEIIKKAAVGPDTIKKEMAKKDILEQMRKQTMKSEDVVSFDKSGSTMIWTSEETTPAGNKQTTSLQLSRIPE